MKPLSENTSATDAFTAFIEVIKKLRDPDGGCPWDLKQTHDSLKPYLVEECYEVLEAIELGDDAELCKELGDVLLQSVLHAQVAADRGAFTIADVVQSVHNKMVRRHPHVFGNVTVTGAEDVLKNWEAIKQSENGGLTKETSRSAIGGIPKALPALIRAERLGEKAAQVGFDWSDIDGVLDKVNEEIQELSAELETDNKQRIIEEFGDLLFALCQFGRKLEIHPEDALRNACDKFTQRFESMESNAEKKLSEYSIEELEALWEKNKH